MDKDSRAFLDACKRFGIDPKLAAAIVTVESSWNPWSVRYEPMFHYLHKPDFFAAAQRWTVQTETVLQKTSLGLMQIMGGTARDLGYQDHLTKLLLPEVGLEWGLRYLATKTQRYRDLRDAISAYNAGSARRSPGGAYSNQDYVDKVWRHYASP